ncbi:hypothetical protein K437DRAFT_256409 [Tilletiaria anomala UBC 951]|uniref:Uncharacterized protein n=1 Tax=Tilletiaria anomala (strain ATCC 24038 / CBS 436.72 / UBC 951) TaxID=1037660 RepID=A0A066W045_TILAU|nr:uncharacterized protein K437DRAFT_256409 [Tilletiaria anomala UBC 951]KDN45888.1 hypothetical protein K437DRAFT_256409 [Tilletiaria anomala UBC 951]
MPLEKRHAANLEDITPRAGTANKTTEVEQAAEASVEEEEASSPANTEPLPFDGESGDEMDASRSAQDELDAAATLASVPAALSEEPNTAENATGMTEYDAASKHYVRSGGGSDLSSDLSDEGEANSGDDDEPEEEEDEDEEGEDDAGEIPGEDDGDDEGEGDGEDEDQDSGSDEEKSEDDASELSEDEGAGQAAAVTISAEAADVATALDALAGIATATPMVSAIADTGSSSTHHLHSRRKSITASMIDPVAPSDAGDHESDEESDVADSQDLTTGDVLASAITGKATISKPHPPPDPNSAGSKLKTSLLANATEDDDLVGAYPAADGAEASLAASAATSREGSPFQEAGTAHDAVGLGASLTAQLAKSAALAADAAKEDDAAVEDAAAGEGAEGEMAEMIVNTGQGTPVIEQAEAEDETTTDETALRRQEAMDALAKIEIGFAMLRDKLYMERVDETCKETAMILDGTHPELVYLSNIIEARRRKRQKLADTWFDQQEQQFSRVAKADEQAIWSNWRASMAQLRRDMMDDLSRKRRKLDREKRALDAPRPPRRHHVFETELVRNPERITRGGTATKAGDSSKSANARESGAATSSGKSKKRQGTLRKSGLEGEEEQVGEYVAFPDIRGLEDEAYHDLEAMGFRPPQGLMRTG